MKKLVFAFVCIINCNVLFSQDAELIDVYKLDSVPLLQGYDKSYRSDVRHKLVIHDFTLYFYKNFDTTVLKEIIQYIDTTQDHVIRTSFILDKDKKVPRVETNLFIQGKNLQSNTIKPRISIGIDGTFIRNDEGIDKELERLIRDFATFETPGYRNGKIVNMKFSGILFTLKFVVDANNTIQLVRLGEVKKRAELIKEILSKPLTRYSVGYGSFTQMDTPPLYEECNTKSTLEKRRKCTYDKVIKFIRNELDMDLINKYARKEKVYTVKITLKVLPNGEVQKMGGMLSGAPIEMRDQLFDIIKRIPDFDHGGMDKGKKVLTTLKLQLKVKAVPKYKG